jgi:hypothetical protein
MNYVEIFTLMFPVTFVITLLVERVERHWRGSMSVL